MAKKSMKVKQQRKAKFSTREYSRCKICGRPHGYLRKYGICRICFINIVIIATICFRVGAVDDDAGLHRKIGSCQCQWGPVFPSPSALNN